MIYEQLSEEEMALYVLFQDESGIDQAEFCYVDEASPTAPLFRAWPIQKYWWADPAPLNLSQGSRSVGKSLSLRFRAFAFPFVLPGLGSEMVVTAPEGNHLDSVMNNIESLFTQNRIAEGMLAADSRGRIKHKPWLITFASGAKIMGKIPKHDGSGVRGVHPTWLEMDESSFYPEAGWTEIVETVNWDNPKARWRCVAEGQKVLTKNGWTLIEDIKVGDLVLTHKNRWKPVLNIWDNGIADCVKVKGNGHHGLTVTKEHKFYTRQQIKVDGLKDLTSAEWQKVEDFSIESGKKTHWASLAYHSQGDGIVPPMERRSRERNIIKDTDNLNWLWLYGLYLAEGYTCDFMAGEGKNRRQHRRIHWCVNDSEAPFVAEQLKKFNLNHYFYKQGEHSVKVIVNSGPIQRWAIENSGSLAHNKFIAPWVFDLSKEKRQSILDGMCYGDAHWSSGRRRWEYSTASLDLALGIKMLGQSLGKVANISTYDPKESDFQGRTIQQKRHYIVQLTQYEDFLNPHSVIDDDIIWSPVQGPIKDAGSYHVYDLEVEDDHSYVLEGIVVSNSHGVTIGPGNTFDDIISGNVEGWKINKLPAMLRPTWTEQERRQKISQYGSVDDIDYRRNVLGLSGNAGVSLVVLHRLMSNVDTDLESDFNESYYNIHFNDALVREMDDVTDLVDPPMSHRKYKKFWMGMDFGLTTSDSCIVVFAETKEPKEEHTRLSLISRITMTRISVEDQVKVIMHLMEIYRPEVFSFDAHTVGQPAFEWLQKEVRENEKISWMLDRVKGYSYSNKMIVGFDDNIEINEADPDGWEEAAIWKLGGDASLDSLRYMVDTKRVKFPYDKPLLGEIQAIPRQEKPLLDEYGKRKKKTGQHTLDALRFAFLAYTQRDIENIIALYEVRKWEAPDMIILDDIW